ncbi:TonB-dependent receptor [Dysgonomonas macrotermitis]|uniref:Outer membrane receptor for Fe3+-dicitrate n=1 Tax=Dysgonomonas macrotermitis TaxID=1346286 RepID=A0A1M4T716_9BACT|nr:TonB-dependent receptor [Dysgonomonas macrotermitis]SHE40128.1 Outer membrane receptor for Fe3+-dicitrate [Dysgonomonas macrotermitis]
MRRKLFFLLFAVLFSSISAFAQSTIKGKVIDKDTKEPLIGVSVFSQAAKAGTSTDLDGSFSFKVSSVSGKLDLTYVGYKTMHIDASADLGVIEMESDAIGLKDVVVTSSIAIRRKTPVAISVIEPEMLETKLSSQEFPEILKSTPGVYATKQGGGYGDSRINLRGFESANIAVMVNGVPVNDMEWGGVYWSNWAGLSDVTRSMQVQRGLGASKVAAPSVGGTINIVTKSTDATKGGFVFYGLGNDNYNKLAFSVSTGLSENGWAMTFLGSKNWGDGYIMGTEFEAYTWFLNISKIINDNHQLSFTAFGSPQWHNQRYSGDYLTISGWQQQKDGYKFNPTYGFDNQGERVNQNRNRYHKPQISLNHFWTINDKSSLSTVAYVSIGDGAGRAWRGSNYNGLYGTNSSDGSLNQDYRDPLTGYMDYTSLLQSNKNNPNGSDVVLTESRNNHFWAGLISTYTTKLTEEIDFYGGIDVRYYAGLHDSKIIDLMGGDFYLDPQRKGISETNWPGLTDSYKYQKLKVGDVVYRDNTGYVSQNGVFSQAEYNKEALSVFLSGSLSTSTYWKKDRYYYSKANQKSDSKTFLGFNVKGGANYNLTEEHNVFFNTGYISRAPFMSGGYFTNIHTSNAVNKDAINEKLFSAEVGYGYRSKYLSANLNLYYTKWMDKTMVSTLGNDRNSFVNMSGINARHQGIELDFVAKPIRNLEITGMVSLGDWIWDSKATGYAYNNMGQPTNDGNNPLAEGEEHKAFFVDMKGVRVGNSAQTTFAAGASYKMFNEKLTVGLDYTHYSDNYANFKIEMPNAGGTYKYYSPWKIPSAGVLDARANYKFKIGTLDATISGNINNVLNQEYISDALDYNARTEGGSSWENVGVMYGFGRTYTASLRVRF